jgi:hypothetical protein
MTARRATALLVWLTWLGTACGESNDDAWTLDQRSYTLGGIGSFAEMVDAGVKRLALSAPLPPQEMDLLIEHAARIAADHNVEIYRESDFLVTDLFAADLTAGKDVLLIYHGSTLREYLDLKAAKHELVDSGAYRGEARRQVAVQFGHLLSYSDAKIDALLSN